jgi:hypothetical protein
VAIARAHPAIVKATSGSCRSPAARYSFATQYQQSGDPRKSVGARPLSDQMQPPVHRASRDRSRGEQSRCAGERRDRGVAEAIGGVELGEDERGSWQAATSTSVRPLLVSQGGRSPSRRGAGRPSRDPGVCTAGSARVSERHLPHGADAAATSVGSRPTPMSAGSGPGA